MDKCITLKEGGVLKMKRVVFVLMCVCLVTSMTSFAGIVTVYENDYEGETVGDGFTEGSAWHWTNGAMTQHAAVYADYYCGGIVVEHTGTIDNSAGAAASDCRFGSKWDITLAGNTSADPADYTISFDLRSVSGNWDPIPLEFFVLTKLGGTADNGYGSGAMDIAQADCCVHIEKNLTELTAGWWQGTDWDMTEPTWSIELGGPGWPGTSVSAGEPAWDQVWTMDNLKITMIPEPATIALLGLGSLALLRRRKS